MVINSRVLTYDPFKNPTEYTPRVELATDPPVATCAAKVSPKSVEFPAVAIVLKSISFLYNEAGEALVPPTCTALVEFDND